MDSQILKEYKLVNTSNDTIVLNFGEMKYVISPGEIIKIKNKEIFEKLKEIKQLSVFDDWFNELTKEPEISKNHLKRTKDKKELIKKLSNEKNRKVSIIILNKDKYNLIYDCVESILEKCKYDDYEIIIGDTGSKDEKVLNYYKELSNRLKSKFRIFYLKNYHYSKNYNYLIEKSLGDYILLLNNDTKFIDDIVSEGMKYILNSKIGTVGFLLLKKNNTIQHCGQAIFFKNGTLRPMPGHYFYEYELNKVDKNLLNNHFVEGNTAACLLINKNVFLSVNGFDENYKDIFQDVDLNLKLLNKGYFHYYVNKKCYHYDNSSRGDRKESFIIDGNYYRKKWSNFIFKIKKPKYSFITIVNNLKLYRDLIYSIEDRNDYELIAINNQSKYFKSASQALNIGYEISHGDWLIFIHQDMILEKDFLNKLDKFLEKYSKYKFGVIGVAGIAKNGQGIRSNFISEPKFNLMTLDEQLLICKRDTFLKFDEDFNDFHFYGAELCLRYLINGYINCIFPVKVEHRSNTFLQNKYWKNNFEKFKEEARKLYRKYADYFSWIGTTTTFFNIEKNMINYYFANKYNLDNTIERIKE